MENGSGISTRIMLVIQSLYLIYMFFVFETTYDFKNAPYDQWIQSFGDFFKHSSKSPVACAKKEENKICDMGRIIAVIMILFWGCRSRVAPGTQLATKFIRLSIFADLFCFLATYLLNLNALFYVLPIGFGEAYLLHSLSE